MKDERLHLRIDPTLKADLQAAAKRNQQTLSQLVMQILNEYLVAHSD